MTSSLMCIWAKNKQKIINSNTKQYVLQSLYTTHFNVLMRYQVLCKNRATSVIEKLLLSRSPLSLLIYTYIRFTPLENTQISIYVGTLSFHLIYLARRCFSYFPPHKDKNEQVVEFLRKPHSFFMFYNINYIGMIKNSLKTSKILLILIQLPICLNCIDTLIMNLYLPMYRNRINTHLIVNSSLQ